MAQAFQSPHISLDFSLNATVDPSESRNVKMQGHSVLKPSYTHTHTDHRRTLIGPSTVYRLDIPVKANSQKLS